VLFCRPRLRRHDSKAVPRIRGREIFTLHANSIRE